MRSRKHLYLAAATAAVTGLAGVSFAALIGILPGFPALVFDNDGVTTYDAGTDLLSIDSCPIAIRFTPTSTPRFVIPTGDPPSEVLSIRAVITDIGVLFGGVPEEDLIVIGEVDPDGTGPLPPISGTLLTGEVAEFGFADSGGTTDEYDFRFTVTGGLLADAFFVEKDIGVKVTSENSSFAGVFTSGFGGGSKGLLGPIGFQPEGGCTPGFWKQSHHFDSWPAPYTPGSSFENVFGRDVPGEPLLVEALRLKRGGLNALMRHATAALLNAASPDVAADPAFDTPAEVIAAFQAAFDSGDFETTKALLEDSNELGCPLS